MAEAKEDHARGEVGALAGDELFRQRLDFFKPRVAKRVRELGKDFVGRRWLAQDVRDELYGDEVIPSGGIVTGVGVVHGGRHHFEITVRDDGLVRCGWSTVAGSLDGLGTDSHSFGFGGTGKKSHGGTFETFGEPFGAGDVVGCSVDLVAGVVNFSINGRDCSGRGSGDTSGDDESAAFSIPASMKGRALFPAVCLKNAECVVNFGHAPWAYPPPPGHDGVARADGGRSHAGQLQLRLFRARLPGRFHGRGAVRGARRDRRRLHGVERVGLLGRGPLHHGADDQTAGGGAVRGSIEANNNRRGRAASRKSVIFFVPHAHRAA